MDLKDKRVDYNKFELVEELAGLDPYSLFSLWFAEASETEPEPNIMIVSTSHNDQPQTRVVLLKEVKDGNFVFYTNYHSTKGRALEQNAKVSILFFWRDQQRQVRIEGIASKVATKESDDYFYSRPIDSQIGAIASSQSDELTTREALEAKFETLAKFYDSNPIKRPEHWGGYAVTPLHFEFWQGRASRLHDRLTYDKVDSSWARKRLYP
ncbi:MAG: pyridoxamine 5'-phosphate oxidase [Bacteroidetes bacterium]|jgi:pyridoxamine 5'-phosphate oxidase|nr:pyridoxamine 5'-phosphate oxidase [Bacteroidota bacterium]